MQREYTTEGCFSGGKKLYPEVSNGMRETIMSKEIDQHVGESKQVSNL